ncbi:MAG: hypothetical protein FWD33_04025 [Alphaproteobacteria bacterium]|nr:hypothetical protein [Alphaproteobacteria bacterium]
MADEKKVSMPSTLTKGVRVAILILIAIIIASIFGISVYPTDSLHVYLSHEILPKALYVCPLANPIWDELSGVLIMYKRQISMGIMALVMFAVFTAAWNLYQNLLKDEFNVKSWEFFFKFLFPLLIAIIIAWQILTWTPNYFREVRVAGSNGRFVLCEASEPGSRPVLADKVRAARRRFP